MTPKTARKKAEEIFLFVYNRVDRNGEIEDFEQPKVIKEITQALLSMHNKAMEEVAQMIMDIDNTYLGPQHREKLAAAIRQRKVS